jgi:hypothetical protein
MIYERDKLIFASGRFVRMLDEGETFKATVEGELRPGAVLLHPERDAVFMFERYGQVFQTRLLGLYERNEDELWLSWAFATPRAYRPFRLQPRALDRWFEPSVYEIDEITFGANKWGAEMPPLTATRSFAQFDDRTYEMTPKGWRLIVGLDPRRGAARRARLRAECAA